MITPQIKAKILSLTPRRYEIFLLIGEGKSYTEICSIPGKVVSIKTYWALQTHIRTTLGVRNATALTALAGAWKEYCDVNSINVVFKEYPRRFVGEIQVTASSL